MAEFMIGDLVRVKGSWIPMCVEDVDPCDPDVAPVVRTVWLDHVGQAHRDGFDSRCLEVAFVQQAGNLALNTQMGTLVPHHGRIS